MKFTLLQAVIKMLHVLHKPYRETLIQARNKTVSLKSFATFTG